MFKEAGFLENIIWVDFKFLEELCKLTFTFSTNA